MPSILIVYSQMHGLITMYCQLARKRESYIYILHFFVIKSWRFSVSKRFKNDNWMLKADNTVNSFWIFQSYIPSFLCSMLCSWKTLISTKKVCANQHLNFSYLMILLWKSWLMQRLLISTSPFSYEITFVITLGFEFTLKKHAHWAIYRSSALESDLPSKNIFTTLWASFWPSNKEKQISQASPQAPSIKLYLSNHGQSTKEPQTTHQSCKQFFAVSSSQMLRE